jgi:hypothetical protein
MDARRVGFSGPEIDQAVADAYLILQSRLPAPDLVTPSGLTISAGGDTFTLPNTVTQWTGNDGGAEYAGDVRIRVRSTGQFLRRRTVDEVDQWRNFTPTVHLSIPDVFCLWEEKDNDVQGRCYPGARDDVVCDLYASLAADDLRDFIGSGTDDMDDVEILFSRTAATALVLYTSADLLARMTEEDLSARRLSRIVAPDWRREADVLLYQEAARRHDIDGVGRTMRRVS